MDELGGFLRSRRDRLRPEDVGLRSYGVRRRVQGLRREELARLAGVSVAYYTRLEQGQSTNASQAVLDALAGALRLDDDERGHLHRLARPAAASRRKPKPERLRPGVRQTIMAIEGTPAVVLGRALDVLGWNRAGHLLLAGHLEFEAAERPADRPNLAQLIFLDAHTRELYADWPEKARATASYLRLAAGRYPDDPGLAAVIGELTMNSPVFAALWGKHPVAECVTGPRRLHHPVVGKLTVTEGVSLLADDPGQRLVIYSAEPGSASEAALRLLTATNLAPSASSSAALAGATRTAR